MYKQLLALKCAGKEWVVPEDVHLEPNVMCPTLGTMRSQEAPRVEEQGRDRTRFREVPMTEVSGPSAGD